MNATLLDTICQAFVSALQAGQASLQAFALPLLGVCAIISFYQQWGAVVASGSQGDVLASFLLTILRFGGFYYLIVNLLPLAEASYDTALQWGLTPTGGSISGGTFRAPSAILDVGFAAAWPIKRVIDGFGGASLLLNFFNILILWLAYFVIIAAFGLVTIHLATTIIEFYLSVMVGTVLIPFGAWGTTASVAEFALSWITGGLIRILVTAAIVGTAVPLFRLLTPAMTPGGDITFYSALVLALAALFFLLLSWALPARAAAIAGRGVSLALHAGTVTAGIASGARGVLTVTNVARGVSSLVRR